MGRFQSSPLKINNTAIAGGARFRYNPNRQIFSPDTDGRGTKTLAGIISTTPGGELTSYNVKGILAACEASGSDLPYKALAATNGLIWVDRKGASDGPTFASGSVHEQGNIRASCSGILVVTGVSASAKDAATITAEAMFISDTGTTDPVQLQAVAAPTDVTSITAFTLDSVTLDATSITDVVSVELSIEPTWQIEHGMKPFPIFVRPRKADWTLTIRHNDASVPRTKGDKDSSASFSLIQVDNGGPTRGSATASFTVTGLIHQGGSEQTQDVSDFTTIVRGRYNAAMPGTWATT